MGLARREKLARYSFSIYPVSGNQKIIRSDPEGGILWVGVSHARATPYWFASVRRGCEMLEYIYDQKVFLRAFDSKVK